MSETLIIYHGGCLDGVAAAACVGEALGWDKVECWPGYHDDNTPAPELVRGRDVVFVDYTLKAPAMLAVYELAHFVQVLDHHVTARAAVEPLEKYGVTIHINENFSGAGLAYDHYQPGGRLHVGREAIAYIEDGDLWRWSLPASREVYAALQTWERPDPQRFADLLFREPWPGVDTMAAQGRALIVAREKRVRRAVASARLVDLFGNYFPMVAIGDPADRSDIADRLLEIHDAPLAGCWWSVGAGKLQVSLRSRPGGANVAEIAQQHGGGGHPGAAGFQIAVGHVWTQTPWYRAFFGEEAL